MLNLLEDQWIPVRTRSGIEKFIRLAELASSDDPPVAFAAVRPDFDAALAQFCIGVFQTVLQPADKEQWTEFLLKPWPVTQLEQTFAQVKECFELMNPNGPAFMQDFDPGLGGIGKDEPLTGLLIDMPGGNTVENNATLFVKAQEHVQLSLPTAAMMLMTLQINAPAGGAGHRTGLRGGGPLTTLIWPASATLLEKLWCNVLPMPPEQSTSSIEEFKSSLPWCVPTAYSPKGETATSRWQLSWCYWATPRPIRMIASPLIGTCALDQRLSDGPLVELYRTRNYGNSYSSDKFQHPLSPYYRQKVTDQSWLPVHPGKENGLTYVDWMALASGAGQVQESATDVTRRSADVVTTATNGSRAEVLANRFGDQTTLWAFGYAMDNMKPLFWMSGLMPVFLGQSFEQQRSQRDSAKKMIDAAQVAFRALRAALRDSACAIDASALFSRTEDAFYKLLSQAIEGQDVRDDWRKELLRKTLRLFEEAISVTSETWPTNGGFSIRSVSVIEKRAKADQELRKKLGSGLRLALDLTVSKSGSPKKKIAKRNDKDQSHSMRSIEA